MADAITVLNAEMGVLTGMRLNVATPFDPGYHERLGAALRTVDEFVFGLINCLLNHRFQHFADEGLLGAGQAPNVMKVRDPFGWFDDNSQE